MWEDAVSGAARAATNYIEWQKQEKAFEAGLREKGLSELEVQTIMNQRRTIQAINANTSAIQSQPAPQEGFSMAKAIFWGSVFGSSGNNNN